ncbi:MAG: hypothetical protein WC710_14660 [Gallionella sp.]|jgi:hypothetical protein
METKDGQHTRRNHRIYQGSITDSVQVCISWWQKDYPNGAPKIASIITIDTGCAHLHICISPAEARALAASLIAHADEVDATQQQIDLLESMPA